MPRKPRAKKLEEVFNPTGFPPLAVAAFEAVRAVNPQDSGTRRFAERIARAISIYESGFSVALPPGPLYASLLYGSHAAPTTQIAEAVARALCGGSLPDGSAPLVTVQCAEFGQHPMALAKLIGPSPIDPRTGELLWQPRLSQTKLEEPHYQIKTEHERVPIMRWDKRFKAKLSVSSLGQLVQEVMQPELSSLAHFANDELTRIGRTHAPYNAVVLFEGLEVPSLALLTQVLTPILRTGFLPIEKVDETEQTDFRNTIVLMSMRDPFKVMEKQRRLGFHTEELRMESDRERYHKVLEEWIHTVYSTLFVDLGDQVMVIGDRTRQAQLHLLFQRLEPITQALAAKGILVSFPDAFCESVIEKSRHPLSVDDPDKGFSDAMLNDVIEEFVLRPLGAAVHEGKLTPGSSFRFEFTEPATHQNNEAQQFDNGVCFHGYYAPTSMGNSENPPLSPRDVEMLFARPQVEIPDTLFVEELERRESKIFEDARPRIEEFRRQIAKKLGAPLGNGGQPQEHPATAPQDPPAEPKAPPDPPQPKDTP